MTARIDAAALELDRALGFGAARHAIERCEVARDGQLWIHVRVEGVPRWFAHDGTALRERTPADETALPAWTEARARAAEPELRHVVSWRPGRRLVALATRSGGARRVHKFVRDGRGPAGRARHALARRACAGSFATPALLAAEGADAADVLVFAFVAGRELDLARDVDRWSAVGRGLARMQHAPDADGIAEHTRADELDVLARAAERWRLAAGPLPEHWEAAYAALASAPHVPRRLVLAHRDLHDGQFLVDGDELTLLDFDLVARAEPELDVANLLEHLALCERQSRRGATAARVRAAQGELLAAWRAASADPDDGALAFYRAATALRLALVHGLVPRWRALAEPLAARALELAAR